MAAIVAGQDLASEPTQCDLTLQREVNCAESGAASTTKTSNDWKPSSRTMHVIELMQQGLSIDDIAVRKDIQVETNAANLRKIRQRARAARSAGSPRDRQT